MLATGIQQSDSIISTEYPFFFKVFSQLLENTELSSLYTVGPGWLPILNVVMYTCQFQTPHLSPLPLLSSNHVFILLSLPQDVPTSNCFKALT